MCMFINVTVGNWGHADGWDCEAGGYMCMKGYSVLSNHEKILLLTFVTMKVSTLDLSSEFVTADIGDLGFF